MEVSPVAGVSLFEVLSPVTGDVLSSVAPDVSVLFVLS